MGEMGWILNDQYLLHIACHSDSSTNGGVLCILIPNVSPYNPPQGNRSSSLCSGGSAGAFSYTKCVSGIDLYIFF